MAIVAKEDNLGARRGVAAGTVDKKTSGLLGANLPAGVLVLRAQGNVLNAPTSAAEVARCIGALEYEPGKLQYDDGLEWRSGDQGIVIQRGEMYVETEESMVSGADVYVRFAAGTGTQLGAIRSDADPDGEDDPTCARLPNARVLYDSSGTTPCIVQLNLPA